MTQPLDWKVSVVDSSGRPSPEFQRKWTDVSTLTSSKITVALGYTPVNKAGDTMTGSLSVSGNISANTTTAVGLVTLKQTADNYAGSLAIVRAGTTDNWQTVVGSDNKLYFGFNTSNKATIDPTTGSYTALSDATAKNIQANYTQDEAVVSLKASKPVRYTMKDDPSQHSQIGFIAQEEINSLPEVVTLNGLDPNNQQYMMNYAGYAPVLVVGWQNHEDRIKTLETQVANLSAQLAKLV